MLYHKEIRKNERFVGNVAAKSPLEHLRSLKTVRKGEVAYDIHGKKLYPGYCLPLFVGKEEFDKYNKIMMDR